LRDPRTLASIGVLAAEPDDLFGLTETGQELGATFRALSTRMRCWMTANTETINDINAEIRRGRLAI
jgi:hypothetical protein